MKAIKSIFGIVFTVLFISSAAKAEAPSSENLVKIKVILNEFNFLIEGIPLKSPLILKAGQRYKLSFENHGGVMHEVLVGRGIEKVDGENEYKENLLENLPVIVTGASVIDGTKRVFEVVTHGFEEFELDPGLRLSLLFTVPESAKGRWELGCFAPGHHEGGMFLPVIIE